MLNFNNLSIKTAISSDCTQFFGAFNSREFNTRHKQALIIIIIILMKMIKYNVVSAYH